MSDLSQSADYRALIAEARRGQDGCEDCLLLGRLASAVEQLLNFVGKVADYSNDGWLAREALALNGSKGA